MDAHTNEQFDIFMSQLKETNQTLERLCDFEKIKSNVANIKLSLCMLNSLIGANDLREAVKTIWKRDKSAFSVMGILIAVRSKEKEKVLDSLDKVVPLCSFFDSVDGVMTFLQDTGLAELFQGKQINNLVDYVFGVETGLDTNARKNRNGHVMEQRVNDLLTKNNIAFRSEVYSKEWPEITGALGTDKKRFDFVIETPDKHYLTEVNFYNGGGSKPNEVARSYSDIATKINAVPGFEFVWITDGIGWNAARNKLHEAYNTIPRIYNLSNVDSFLEELKTQKTQIR